MCVCYFYVPAKCKLIFLSPLPTNSEGSVPCFQIPRLGSGTAFSNYDNNGYLYLNSVLKNTSFFL